MDPFQVIFWCIAITFAVVIARPFVAILNLALRGCIKSTRKTIHQIHN